MSFQIFTPAQIDTLRKAGGILSGCLRHVAALVHPGVTTGELDRAAEAFIRSHEGATPAFKGYHGYTATLCTSVNEECVHGIPGSRVLEEGDIVALDCGVLLGGLYTDACITVPVGAISPEAQKLLSVTEEALKRAVTIVKAGVRTGDISSLIQKYVEGEGFTIVRPLTGHGLGDTLHQFPDLPNYGKKGSGPLLPAHTIIAIEPIVSVSGEGIRDGGDGWTLTTDDGSLSAHFEHTVLVTTDGCEILA